jgi:hypothetical protein
MLRRWERRRGEVHHVLRASTPSTAPLGTCAAIAAEIRPSPQPTSRTRSPPVRVSDARLFAASHSCSAETSR